MTSMGPVGPAVTTVLAAALLAGAHAPALAVIPDYLLLDRCEATRDEVRPFGGGTWQTGFAFVALADQATGGGGWLERHAFQYTTYAYLNGPNGYAEYGTGDDICLGAADELPGTLTYEVATDVPDRASGLHALTDSPSGKYLPLTNAAAVIDRSFDLTGLGEITLLLFHHHALRWGANTDSGYVEVNVGNGWVGVDPENTPQSSHYKHYYGDNHMFKRGEVDLSAFAGEAAVQIRFRLGTDHQNQDDGWFLDDVRLLGDGDTLFFDDLESGTGQWILDSPWGLTLPGYSYDTTLGDVDQTGLYTVTPVSAPVAIGDGMGLNCVHAAYTEAGTTRHAYARVYHTAPQFVVPPDLGYEDICTNTVAVEESAAPVHSRLVLRQNAPNPFNPSTSIAFKLAEAAHASLTIYDESGRLVRSVLADELLPAGEHTMLWDGRDERGRTPASGVYLYELRAGDQTLSRKMIMVR